jgi:hypothetical protein
MHGYHTEHIGVPGFGTPDLVVVFDGHYDRSSGPVIVKHVGTN